MVLVKYIEILEHTLEEAFLQGFEWVIRILDEGVAVVLLAKRVLWPMGWVLNVQVTLEAVVVVGHVDAFTQRRYDFVGSNQQRLHHVPDG